VAGHGLKARFAHIENREASVAEGKAVFIKNTFPIGSPMPDIEKEFLESRLETLAGRPAFRIENAD